MEKKYCQKQRAGSDGSSNMSNNNNNGGGEKKKGEASGGSGISSNQQNFRGGQSCNNAPKYNNNRLNGRGGVGGEIAHKDKKSGDGEVKVKCNGGGSGGGGNNHKYNSQRMEHPPMVFQQQEWDFGGFPPLRGYGGGGYPGYHSHETHFQPKAYYSSDYRPSQSYLADFRNMDYFSQPVANPNYMKSIIY